MAAFAAELVEAHEVLVTQVHEGAELAREAELRLGRDPVQGLERDRLVEGLVDDAEAAFAEHLWLTMELHQTNAAAVALGLGVMHGIDLLYVFGNTPRPFTRPSAAERNVTESVADLGTAARELAAITHEPLGRLVAGAVRFRVACRAGRPPACRSAR